MREYAEVLCLPAKDKTKAGTMRGMLCNLRSRPRRMAGVVAVIKGRAHDENTAQMCYFWEKCHKTAWKCESYIER